MLNELWGWSLTFDKMPLLLAATGLWLVLCFYRLHRDADRPNFDLTDLLMENGRLSKIAVGFFVVLFLTSWIMIDLQLKAKMTEGYLGLYGGLWVTPLVARVVWGQKPVAETSKGVV
jgi:hypothetical protein